MQRGKVMVTAVLALAGCVVGQPPASMGVPIELVRHLYPSVCLPVCVRVRVCVRARARVCGRSARLLPLPQLPCVAPGCTDRCCCVTRRTHVTRVTSKKSSASSTVASSM